MKIDKKKLGVTIKNVCGWAACAVLVIAPSVKSLTQTIGDVKYLSGKVTYSDAVSAILHSSMWSDNKAMATSVLPKDADAELYKSVIEITKSSLFSEDKLKAIQEICNSTKES